MECKVKIGVAYEPKWFERRYTQGTYSGKNVPLDADAMNLQSVLLGTQFERSKPNRLWVAVSAVAVVALIYLITYL
jgi:hypothetical protein